MKTHYSTLPAIAPQNITLLLGENIGLNIDASLAHTKELVSTDQHGAVLYLNTVQTARSMFESARSLGLEPDGSGFTIVGGRYCKQIYILNIERGDLHKAKDKIVRYLANCRIQYVVVNSWEFAARSSRYREEAVFFLKELTGESSPEFEPVSVLVYAEELERKTRAQKIQRGGYGKLAGLAKKVECITIEQEFETDGEREDREEIITNYELGITNREAGLRSTDSQSAREKHSGTDFSPLNGQSEEATSDMQIHFAPVFVPTSDIGRRTSPASPINPST
jgi:hypothetical protein